ncbi:hypothetical protein glysoja_012624 [Glycine soja]|nr:hypothetical protein glysoja_012624 [Glycine soja]
MEMVLVDSKGNRVYGSIKRTLIYKFDKTLQKEKLYSVFWCYCENREKMKRNRRKTKMNVIQIEDDGMFESPSLDLSQITDSTALSMSKNFLHNTIRTTIGGLKDFFEDTCFAVFGIVKHVVDDEEW